MAQACPNCLWYSPDMTRVCPHCGELMPAADALPDAYAEAASPTIWSWVKFVLGVAALGLFGFVTYGRYGARLGGAIGFLRDGWRDLRTWLLGPQGQYADFIGIAVLVSALFWFALWLYQRLNR